MSTDGLIAPGVYNQEVDLSYYLSTLSTTIPGVVGAFQKGSFMTPGLVNSPTQLLQQYGPPLAGNLGFAWWAAMFYLQRGGTQLKLVRVGDDQTAKAAATLVSSDSTGDTILGQVRGVTEGAWANGYQVVIASVVIPSSSDPAVPSTTYVLSVYLPNTNVNTARPVETWYNVVFNNPADPQYVTKVINEKSLYIELEMVDIGVPNTGVIFTLAGGNNGANAIDADHISEGLDLFSDPRGIDVNLLSAPGFNHDRVVASKIISICASRMDCLGVLDTPDLSSAQDMVDYIMGDLGSAHNPYSAYSPLASSNRAAVWGPWVKINDTYNQTALFMPPSVQQIATFGYNDRVRAPWFAAAGVNRGIYYDALDIRFMLNFGDVVSVYGYPVNCNPIIADPSGIIADGNKNLQRVVSLLQQISVVRMLMYAEKVIASGVRGLIWEPDDPITWRQYTGIVQPFLNRIADGRGITQFAIKCDKNTNTPDQINNGNLVAELHIIPTRPVERIINTYVIHPNGVDLTATTIQGTTIT